MEFFHGTSSFLSGAFRKENPYSPNYIHYTLLSKKAQVFSAICGNFANLTFETTNEDKKPVEKALFHRFKAHL